MKTIQQQQEALEMLFGGKPKQIVEEPITEEFVIPIWQSVAETYPEAVQKALDAIAASRPFYNWRAGEIDADHLRESEAKKEAMSKIPVVGGKWIVFNAQLGFKYKGKSVKWVREHYTEGEFGLGAFEVACILLTHPEVLSKYEDLWIDCPGDEYKWSGRSEFGRAPLFGFSGGRLKFGASRVGGASARCGSASGFVPQ